MQRNTETRRNYFLTDRQLLVVLVILVNILFVYNRLSLIDCSLWLDETSSFWIIKDGFGSAIDKSMHYFGQSPLYYLIMHFLYSLLGFSETIFRLPSLIFLIFSEVLIYKIAKRILGVQTALFAPLLLILNAQILFQSINMRPYTLALFFSLLSIYYLFKFIEKPSVNFLPVSLSFLLSVYFHYLFAGICIVYLSILLANKKIFDKNILLYAAISLIIICIGLYPLIEQMFILTKEGATKSLGPNLDLYTLFVDFASTSIYLHPLLILSLALPLIIIKKILKNRTSLNVKFSKKYLFILIVWSMSPYVLYYIIYQITGYIVWQDRFFIWSYPAHCILFIYLLNLINMPKMVNAALSTLISVFCIFYFLRGFPEIQECLSGYREASSALNSIIKNNDDLTLVYGSHYESSFDSWLKDPVKQEILMSPVYTYPIYSDKLPLPFDNIYLNNYYPNLIRKIDLSFKKRQPVYLYMTNRMFAKDILTSLSHILKEQFGYRIIKQKTFYDTSVYMFSLP